MLEMNFRFANLLRMLDTPPDLQEITALLDDPSSSYWLRSALKSALLRDPLDAAHDAGVLARVLRMRFDTLASPAAQGESVFIAHQTARPVSIFRNSKS